ncbi:hypothetical protein ADL19_31565 [Streptomyces purpurogeneiscleroticus]|nr:hypothetical protein ADL19_31565 [Streptomyces purpurogeneiscleroticus]
MTKSKTSGFPRTRNYDRPINKPSTIRGPNYLAQEHAQEFVPSQVLIKAADLEKPRRPTL